MSAALRQFCVLVLLCACADDPTQIVVVVNTDLEVGADIEVVELEVNGTTVTEMVPPSPRTALLKHTGGELGPISIMVRGLRDGLRRIEREAVVTFVEGETLLLNLCLSRECLENSGCPGARTCTEDGCRSPVFDDLPEYNGTIPTSCGAVVGEDGGMDAAFDTAEDTNTDGGIDTGSGCALESGICVADVVMPGDRIVAQVCDGSDADVRWTWGRPGAPADVEIPFFAPDEAGDYLLEAEQVGIDGCGASQTVRVANVRSASDTGAPGATVVDFAARLGVAFATTRTPNAWAILPTGWRDMRSAASGAVPVGDLECVGVLEGLPVFGTLEDEMGLYAPMSAPDFSFSMWDVFNLDAPDDRGFAASTQADGSGPLAVAYGEGIAAVDVGGSMELLSGYFADYGADVAVSESDPDNYGSVWVLSRVREEVINLDFFGGAEYNGGNPESVDVGEPNAIEVSEDAGHATLWICGSDGLFMYDLRDDIDIDSPLSEPPVAPCNDIAVDGQGGVWVAADSGLQRFDWDGVLRANLALVGGYSFVAFATNRDERELWALTPDNDVRRISLR